MSDDITLDTLSLEDIKNYTKVSRTDEFGDIYLGNIEQILAPGEVMIDPDIGNEVLEDKDEDRVVIWWYVTPGGPYRSFDSRNRTFTDIHVDESTARKAPMVPVKPQCDLCKKFSLLGGICTEDHEGPSKACFDQAV